MASNLATIGLAVETREDFENLVTGLADSAREGIQTAAGDYTIWRSRTGAEVWIHVAPPQTEGAQTTREIKGLTPFFDGASEIPVNIASRIKRPEDNDFEGAFYAWVGADPSNPESSGDYPLVFDSVDFAAFADQALPASCRVRIAGFCRELKAFPSQQAFDASQTTDPGFAAQSFFPVGLFAEAEARNQGEETPPSSNALINGVVRGHRILVNELTEQPFHWLLVESLSATYDIVASPEVISGDIVDGGVVQASCWLFGRILR